MSDVFSITSGLNEKVICSRDTWYGHIVRGHGLMQGNLSAVIDTIESPDEVYESSSNVGRKVYFKQSDLSSYSIYTKVITKSISDSTSEVVTAFPQKTIGGGIGDQIYPK